MVEYSQVDVILSNLQLDKLKTNKQKYQTNVTLTMNIKMFNENNLLYELLLTARQKTKSRNTFENNMSTDVKLPKAQMSKIIQFGGFLGSLLSKLAGRSINASCCSFGEKYFSSIRNFSSCFSN